MLKLKIKTSNRAITIERRCAMTIRQLQIQAYREWNGSSETRRKYHTFDYYWFERYARVYQHSVWTRLINQLIHWRGLLCSSDYTTVDPC